MYGSPLQEAYLHCSIRHNTNLWLMKSNVPHIDPETNIFGPSAVGSGVEYSAIPTTRSWGFNIKLTF